MFENNGKKVGYAIFRLCTSARYEPALRIFSPSVILSVAEGAYSQANDNPYFV
jgi:hypothetical protein